MTFAASRGSCRSFQLNKTQLLREPEQAWRFPDATGETSEKLREGVDKGRSARVWVNTFSGEDTP